jgi:hypothetical protein
MKRRTAARPAPKSKLSRRTAVKRSAPARRPAPVKDIGPRELDAYSSLSLSGGDFGFSTGAEFAEFSEDRAAS